MSRRLLDLPTPNEAWLGSSDPLEREVAELERDFRERMRALVREHDVACERELFAFKARCDELTRRYASRSCGRRTH